MAPPSPNMGATSLGYPPGQPGYPTSPYPTTGLGHPDAYRAPSPFRGPAGGPEPQAILSRSRAPSPNPMGGPPGIYSPRSRAPSPLPGGMPYGNRSRAPSPNPMGGAPPGVYSPRSRAPSPLPGGAPVAPYGGQQPGFAYPNTIPRSPNHGAVAVLGGPDHPPLLPPPDGFSRPANLAQSYAFFETMKIQDMDDFYENMPRMPKVLVPHDVYHEDWIRFIQVRFSRFLVHFWVVPLSTIVSVAGPRDGVGWQAANRRPGPPVATFRRGRRARRPLEHLVLRLARRRGHPLQRPRATLRLLRRPDRAQPPGLRLGLGLERLALLKRLVRPRRRQIRARRGRRARLLRGHVPRLEAEEGRAQGREEAQEQGEEGPSPRP